MSGAAEEVATGAEVGLGAVVTCLPTFQPHEGLPPQSLLCPKVVDLLVAMCRAALESPRKSIIFEPYPSVVDPNDPKTLAFNPKVSAGGDSASPHQGVMGSPKDPSDGHPPPAARAEEELRAAAEGSGQRDVHPGDDPGTWRGPTAPWPPVTS